MRHALFGCLLLLPVVSSATVHRVPSEYATIQAGIDAAAEGDTVLVAPGTYTGVGNRDLNFNGTNLVLASELGSEVTVIDCEHASGAITFDHGESAASSVGGFTLRRGASENSGGVYCNGASPRLHHLVIEDGGSWGQGGGVCLRESAAVLEDMIIRDNWAGDPWSWSGAGGGLAAFHSSPKIRRVRFETNSAAAGDPGGECCPQAYGGGAYFRESTPDIEDVVFFENRVSAPDTFGGGLYADGDISLRGATFVGNSAWSGAALCVEDGVCSLDNSVIAFHGGGIFGAGIAVSGTTTATCCLVYGNAQGDWVGGLAGQAGVAGNVTADPLFCDRTQGVLTVADLSPCLPGNNTCGVQLGATTSGCTGLAVESVAASTDRSDGIVLTWTWSGPADAGFRIDRDGTPVHWITDTAEQAWLDENAAVGVHAYALRAIYADGDGPAAYASGKRLPREIRVLSPNGGEVLHFGTSFEIRWQPDAGSSGELVDVEISRSGPAGPWETLFAGTPHDGEETWPVGGEYATDCWLRVRSAEFQDASDLAFKVGTRTVQVPYDAATIGEALQQSAAHDTVLLAPGTYSEHSLSLPSGVVLSGTGGDPAAVIIDAQAQGPILTCDNAKRETVIAGVSFQNGHSSAWGGAISCSASMLLIRNCDFAGNWADQYGGALGSHSGAGQGEAGYPVVEDCDFAGNGAGLGGGAIAMSSGGGRILRCRLIANSAPLGGALHLYFAKPRLRDCAMIDNRATADGGAFYFSWVYDVFADYTMESCLLAGNTAVGSGGAIYSELGILRLKNFTFVGNDSGGIGRTLFARFSSLQLLQCLLQSEQADAIVTCNMADDVIIEGCVDVYSPAGDAWSDCLAGGFGANGNFSLDPLFCNAAAGDYRLDGASPCLPGHNDCGVQIGALGWACGELVPVALASFTATPGTGAVDLTWEADELADFRLMGTRDAASWDVAWQAAGSGRFHARDACEQLAPGGEVSYRLEGRLPGEAWQLLRELAVTLPPAFATRLLEPHPNPFNPAVTLPFTLAVAGRVRLEVFDLAGRRIATLADGHFAAGEQGLVWDGRDAAGHAQASGVYFARFVAAGHNETKRLVLLR